MNSYFRGKNLNIELIGGSHSPEIVLLLEGFPIIDVDLEKIQEDINRRKPGKVGTTTRFEPDVPIIISGIENGKTTGKLIEVSFENKNYDSNAYSKFYDHPRPGHVDFVSRIKYQDRDFMKGSGHFSGRMTLPLTFVGSLSKQALNLKFESKLVQVGALYDMEHLEEYLEKVSNLNDSVGGVVEVTVKGLPIGVGGPIFQRLSAKIAQTVLAIPGTKGIEFGEGFNSVNLFGSQFNDVIIDQLGTTKTNHAGGLSGGITNGNDLVIRVAFRPPSSIKKPQTTYSFKTDQLEELTIEGRHDVCYVTRALVVVESMVAIALLDEML